MGRTRRAAARLLLAAAASILAACTYGPEEQRGTVEQVLRLGDSYRAVVVVRNETFRRPTGLSTFPDGGRWRFTTRSAALYLVDAAALDVRLLTEESAPDELWESFGAWVAGSEGDSVVYVRLTGCPRGGECHPRLTRTRVRRLTLDGRVSPVDSVPTNAGLPGVMVARRPGEQRYVRFGTGREVVTARFEEGGAADTLFRVSADGSLVTEPR